MHEDDPNSLELIEETLSIGKRSVVTGRVRVRTETETFEAIARAELAGEAVDIERVPVDRLIDTAPPVRTEGDLTIVPVVEEVIVVEKRLVLKEEIHIRRRQTQEVVETPVPLRRQRAVVERVDPTTGAVLPENTVNKEIPNG